MNNLCINDAGEVAPLKSETTYVVALPICVAALLGMLRAPLCLALLLLLRCFDLLVFLHLLQIDQLLLLVFRIRNFYFSLPSLLLF